MRKTMKVILLTLAFYCLTATVFSQSISLDLNSVTVKEAIQILKDKTGYSFIYEVNDFDSQRKISVKTTNKSIDEVVTQILIGQKVSYTIKDKSIIVTKNKKTTTEATEGNDQSSKKISGLVTDEKGDPIIGASVMLKGEKVGVITNFDGKFNLEASSKSILVISYIGYLAKELKVSTQTSFAIKLTENSKALEEVVVIGYGTMKKSDINAAIVSIKPEDLQMNSASSLTQTLSGKAAGVTVLGGSAQPGGGAEILIRGAASVGAGNEPLYVLDGFPLSNTGVEPGSGNRYSQGNRNILNSINPNDIASIEILKDASATAIYGSRGCNGVILITTKRGNKGLKVEYSGNYSVQTITKRPEMLTAAEQMTEANSYLYDQSLIRYTAYPYGTRDVSTLPTFVPKYTQTEIDAAGVGTDWYGLITQMGKVNQQNISISKGTEDTKVMFSLNYFDQEGVVKTSGLQRYSGRLNLDQKLTSWLDYGISLTGSVVENQNAALGGGEQENSGIIQSALQYSPRIIAQREENGEYILNPNQALIPNPLSFLDIKDNTTQKRWLTNLFMNVHFSNYLTLRVSAGMDDQRATRKTYLPKTFMYGKGQNGVGSINNSFKTDYLTETTLSYNRKLNNIHNLSGLLGYSYQQFNSDGSSGNNYSFFSDAFLYNNLSAGEGTPTVGSYRSTSLMASYFGRLQYSLKDRYLLTFTARMDGSDKFGTNNKYGFFPSGAFAWRVTQEPFMQSQKVVSDLKLRLSLGQTGNSNIGTNAYEYYAANGHNYYLGGIRNTGVGLTQLPNPDLKWETTTELNFGVDYGFFNNRISGSVELFYKQISDLLTSRALMSNSIISSVPDNVGKTQSKGLEISMSTRNITGPFVWNTDFTFTSYQDRWLERDPKVILQPYQLPQGPLRAVYGFIADGIMQPGETVATMPLLIPGQMKVKDISGLNGVPDGKIDVYDVQLLGIGSPKFTMGLNNSFSYKNFDLSFFLYSSIGVMKSSGMNFKYGTLVDFNSISTENNFLTDVKGRWSSQNLTSTMPSGVRNPYLVAGHYAFEEVSFLRVKNITLGYDLKKLLNINYVNKCRLYVDAQNVFTLTNYSGLDPEFEDSAAPYPLQRTISIGLNLTFN